MAGGVEQTDRPGMAGWVLASACAGALGGFVLPAPPGACFLSAGLVGLAQGLLLRRWLDWWSWALTTLIIGGAGHALARMLTTLGADQIQSRDVELLVEIAALNAAGGALVGACQAFLLSGRYRRATIWLPASAFGAALFWTAPAMALLPGPPPLPAESALASRVAVAGWMMVSWGGLALGTSLSLRRLRARGIR